MSGWTRTRELLRPPGRTSRDVDDDVDEAPRARAIAPGKCTREDEPRGHVATSAPGKRSRYDGTDEDEGPAAALRYADSILAPRIDRRAEPGARDLDEEGALASAFDFIGDARGGHPLPAALARRLSAELGIDL